MTGARLQHYGAMSARMERGSVPVARRWRVRSILVGALAGTIFFHPVDAVAQSEAEALQTRQERTEAEYRQAARQIALSEQKIAAINEQIAGFKNDNAALTAALIQTAKTERKLGEDIGRITLRLTALGHEEGYLRQSLHARRDVLAGVLGALQRMGLNPPPAILVRPEDALSSVRSAILLGAVIPELRLETQVLFDDLNALARIVASKEAERDRLRDTVTQQEEEKKKLTLLLEEKRNQQAQAEQLREDERQQAAALAEKAGNLKELIAILKKEIVSLEKAETERQRLARDPGPENRLKPAAPFGQRHGTVFPPVSGQFANRYGDRDDTGTTLKGDILRTQSGAIVTAPAGATVLYAGPFRSYGQLLILDAGGGYHIVLAGMDRISATLGQSILAGEPVGIMGETRLASIAGMADDGTVPELYVEFRKDGKPVDPAPWWTLRHSGRTGNET